MIAIADFLMGDVPGFDAAAAAAAAAPDPAPVAATAAPKAAGTPTPASALDQMSEDELATLLAEKLAGIRP
jgi:hypothetical protein